MTICPGTPLLTARDVEYRLTVSSADAIFCTPKMASAVDDLQSKTGKFKDLIKIVVGDDSENIRSVYK